MMIPLDLIIQHWKLLKKYVPCAVGLREPGNHHTALLGILWKACPSSNNSLLFRVYLENWCCS
ncbi:unnamed protein product [Notodromas monacha]|uniref:Uncharacterized protein n=1 Tax=Notodromas monacha TaxID=399045 RepID=A0A7R9BVC7_9CRUS|nr:unnamed protein product [Notodromas monacha]CAG0922452.1 unnamed protein product [Notodromas monacha]